jgi:ammonium transporter, Amt family
MKLLIDWTGWRSVNAGLSLLMLMSAFLVTSAVHAEEPAGAAGDAAAPAAAASPGAETPPAAAPAGPPSNADLKVMLDTVWVLSTAFLVFFMNLGFAAVESGMCRAKNCVNILSKNFIVFAVSSIAFWAIGWGLMFGNDADGKSDGGYIGKTGLWFVSGADNSPATGDAYKGDYGAISWTGVPLSAKFFFQLVFTGTAATIVSGAVAERIKYHTFIVFSFIMGTVIYPVVGHWVWGGGWLAAKGFFDFAGSTQVHSIGGWAALAGVLVLGPRTGKYIDGKVHAIPGHNMSLATIGCFVLWFGWFGFNPGSTMAVDPALISHVAVTTNTAAAFATITATITAWALLGKPDLGMTLNGCLAGLVAITAPCAFVSIWSSVIIGSIAGVVVVVAVMAFDRAGIDDPVGATSVHLVNGVFGTLCIGLFTETSLIPAGTTLKAGLFTGGGPEQLIVQATGVLATLLYVFPVSLIVWFILKATLGLRVTKEEELEGLDLGEHGNEAYPGFVMQAPGGH